MTKRILVSVTGASGSIYAQRLIECLYQVESVERIYVIATPSAEQVIQHELKLETEGFSLRKLLKDKSDVIQQFEKIRVFKCDDLFAPIASGSSAATHTLVVPCSMGSMARIAQGISSNLIERSADVALKQKLPLLICPRETPFNQVHLENMLRLSNAGAHIIPLMPAFYQKPESVNDLVDFMVGRIMESLGLAHELYRPWNPRLR